MFVHVIERNFQHPVFWLDNLLVLLCLCNIVKARKQVEECGNGLQNRFRNCVSTCMVRHCAFDLYKSHMLIVVNLVSAEAKRESSG